MPIKFKARVLLELGAELISSDAVALYELVKNGIDAKSKRIHVDVDIAMQPSAHRRLTERWSSANRPWQSDAFLDDVTNHLEQTASDEVKARFLAALTQLSSWHKARECLDQAVFEHNVIAVRDFGKGMSRRTLVDCYLTIGTPGRLHEKAAFLAATERRTDEQVPLGEKGIGRLAAMRLGHFVTVLTGTTEDRHWQGLVLDWRPVFDQPDLDSDALNFEPTTEASKLPTEQGTDILIQDLQSDWSAEKLRRLWASDLAKLADPFDNDYASRFLRITFQGEDQKPDDPFDRPLLAHADAYCRITYRTEGPDREATGPALQVAVEYRRFSAGVTTTYQGAHLHSVVSNPPRRKGRAKASDRLPGSDEVIAALVSLGDFDAEFYWFNRGRIMRKDMVLWQQLAPFVNAWSGGLLVYRDGYRVYPYGAPSDDWLDLDRKALASSAFKLNRAQIIGRLKVSSRSNPRLKDQTNREGFRDCPEKEALRRLLRQAIVGDCRSFLEKVEKDEKVLDPTTVSTIDKKIEASKSSAVRSLLSIQKRVPDERETIREVLAELNEMEDAWKRAKDALKDKNSQIQQYVHLAGVGLSVEFIAHELARSTEHALSLLNDREVGGQAGNLEALRAQLKTINKRVRVIDELSIPGRQIKDMEDLGEIVDIIKDVYSAKAQRHGIDVTVRRHGTPRDVRVERGQIIQILDNLMSNAMYWLEHRIERDEKPKILINVQYKAMTVEFEDNGPGITESIASRVFDAFYTTKPAGEGRGLGLAIAKQLAKENGADLFLLPLKNGRHPGFVLNFGD